jgi:cell division protein FtsW (lipid II flippase)
MMHGLLKRFPWMLCGVCLAITGLGLCGLVRADELYGRSQLIERQIVWLMMALPLMLAIALAPTHWLRAVSVPAYIVSALLLVVTLFMAPINGSRRWIPLGLFDFQPSEPARLAFVLTLASYLMYRDNHRTLKGLVPPLVLAMVPMLLIMKEPDLDTAVLYIPVLYFMLFAAGAKTRHLVMVTVMGVACLPILWTQMSAEQQSRLVSVVIQRDGGLAPTGDGFHLHQSKQVLALGGFWGSMNQEEPPIDDPSAWQLPASRTDFIFVMIGEKLGFPGCVAVMILYAILIWRSLLIARRTQDPFGRLVITGVVTLMSVQTILNTGMTVGLLPITGTTLPLCSYGGSSLLTTYAAIGLIMNIEMHRSYDVAGQPFVFRSESYRNVA